MDRVMESWKGAPLDAVIAQWGYPHQEQTIAGRKIYRWSYSKTFVMPSTTTGTVTAYGINTMTTGGGVIRGDCVRTLEVNELNIVVRWQWEGNNCPFADILEYSDWQRRSP